MRTIILTPLVLLVASGCQPATPPEAAHRGAFRASVLKPLQDALAGDPKWRIAEGYATVPTGGAPAGREGIVFISKGAVGEGLQTRDGVSIDVTYTLQGTEWEFKSAVGRVIKDGRTARKFDYPGTTATVAEIVAWVQESGR